MGDQASQDPDIGDSRDDVVVTSSGRYRVVELLGAGGFGEVYLAEQVEPVRRRVALKVVKLGMDTREVIARFEIERQALAVMDHPNIAKVLDAGATRTGRPYFVMELVRGVPITDYCDSENCSMSERLELFVEVCRAVQHAHQKGIIHRDIKPSNVLVALQDGKPVPKVIDFGIARATSRHLTEHEVFTEQGRFIGTPAYMSPEQAEMTGLDIDTRSDIYSLGVLLYELLTGTTPFDPKRLRSAGFMEVCRIIREVDPPRPSTRLGEMSAHETVANSEAPTVALGPAPTSPTSSASVDVIARHRRTQPTQLARSLRGDLDWIVMRALDKSRMRRYETANGLALDIERHLADEAVLARPPSAVYRTGKFVRRHRAMVAASAAIFVALAAGITGTTVFMMRAMVAETAAVAERRSVERLLTFMLGDLKDELEPIGRLDALDGAAQQVVNYYARRPASELDAEDLLQYGQGLELVGKTQLSRAELAAAERAFRDEVRLLDELRRKEPANTECLFWLSQAHFYLGAVASRRDDRDGALAGFDRYLELAEELLAHDRDEPKWQLEVAYASSSRATTLDALGRTAEARLARSRSVDIKRRLVARDPANRDWLLALANDLTFLADDAIGRCEVDEAVAAAREARDLVRGYADGHPDDLDASHRLSIARQKLAEYTGDAGDHEAALRLLRRNQKTTRRLVKVEPDNTRWVYERAVGFRLIGVALIRLGRAEEALTELRALRRELEQLLERGSERADTIIQFIATLRWSGEAELAERRSDRVEPLVSAARVRLTALPSNSPGAILNAARLDLLQARASSDLGRGVESELLAERALERLAVAPAEAPAVAEVRAAAYLMLGRAAEAVPLLDTVRGCGVLPDYLARLARESGLEAGQ